MGTAEYAIGTGWFIASILIGAGFFMMGPTPEDFMVARYCFVVAALVLGAGGLVYGYSADGSWWLRILITAITGAVLFVGLNEGLRLVTNREEAIATAADDAIVETLSAVGPQSLVIVSPNADAPSSKIAFHWWELLHRAHWNVEMIQRDFPVPQSSRPLQVTIASTPERRAEPKPSKATIPPAAFYLVQTLLGHYIKIGISLSTTMTDQAATELWVSAPK